MSGVLKYCCLAVSGFGILALLLSVAAGKVIGVELMAVFQLSHMSLISLPVLSPGWHALTYLGYSSGLNIYGLSSTGLVPRSGLPRQMRSIGLSPYLLQNFNANLLLLALPYLAAGLCFILSKTVYKS